MTRPRVYSYFVRYDDGASPNPFWGLCTLVISKPVIRFQAEVGDWIVGLVTKNPLSKDSSVKVVYIMQVTQKMTMRQYDGHTKIFRELHRKKPNMSVEDPWWLCGDSIYDFAHHPLQQRDGVHRPENQETDLVGTYALLSSNFVYFGRKAIPLPVGLIPIATPGREYWPEGNEPLIGNFLQWWKVLADSGNKGVKGDPQMGPYTSYENAKFCAQGRLQEALEDIRWGWNGKLLGTVEVTCQRCGYSWPSLTNKRRVSCSRCRTSVTRKSRLS